MKNEKMNICLIKPPILHKGMSFARFATPPLGLAYISAALKEYVDEVKVIDASAEGINDVQKFERNVFLFGLKNDDILSRIDFDVNIFCLSLMFTNNWLNDRILINEIKKARPNALIIAGGEHVTALPDFCLKKSALDIVVLGEGEEIIKDLVCSLKFNIDLQNVKGIVYKKGDKIIFNEKKNRILKISEIAWPDWESFPTDIYFKNKMTHGVHRGITLPVNATRGCPYECTFCSNPIMWGKRYQMRTASEFVDELQHWLNKYGTNNFEFYDLTAIIKKSWILDLGNEIINRGLNINYQLPSGTRVEAIDYEVAQMLYKSGCKNITYAPESGSDRILKSIKKRIRKEKMFKSIAQSSQAGLNIKLNMIMGFPEDTHKDIWLTFWFLIKCSWYGANDAAPAIFSPYPGSELFDKLVEEGKIDIENDEYFYDIINTYDILPNKVYCNNISSFSIKIYIFLFLFIFYGSNYIFRPKRFFKTIYNIIKGKEESKIEQIILNNLIKPLKTMFK